MCDVRQSEGIQRKESGNERRAVSKAVGESEEELSAQSTKRMFARREREESEANVCDCTHALTN